MRRIFTTLGLIALAAVFAALDGCAPSNRVYFMHERDGGQLIKAGSDLGGAKQTAQQMCLKGDRAMCLESQRIDRVILCERLHWAEKGNVDRCAVKLFGPEPKL